MQSIVVFCAHSDDQVLGAGATLAKYAKEGYEIHIVVFSFGELTHPWLKREHSATMRVEESKHAGKHLGFKEMIFLGLKEGKFKEEFESKNLKDKIVHLLITKKPEKIFLHAPDDFHPDHRDVFKIVTALLKERDFGADVYAYEVWNPLDLMKSDWPQMYVDVTDTFKVKLQALGKFKSQKVALTVLIASVLIGSVIFGIRHGCRFAERFYKVPL
ncbi:MAG: PIG-L deacetylase family protein [Nanoarchaeota archaeon]